MYINGKTIEEWLLQKTSCKIIFLEHVLHSHSNFWGVATDGPQIGRSLARVEIQCHYEDLVGMFLQIFHEAPSHQRSRVA
jgi:hypothetical protein